MGRFLRVLRILTLISIGLWIAGSFSVLAAIPAALPLNPDLRRGIWFVTIWDTNMDRHSDALDDSLGDIIEKLSSNKVDWVAIKCADGTSYYLDEGHALAKWIKDQDYENQEYSTLTDVIEKFHDKGIKVLGWQYIYGIPGSGIDGTGGTPADEAKVARKILDISGIDGFIIDAETEYEDEDKNKDTIGDKGTAQKAVEYMEAVREGHLDSFIAYSTFSSIYNHSLFPYVEFGEYCNAFMPQVYWYDKDPRDWLRDMEKEWSTWNKACNKEDKFADSIKPIIPTGQGYDVLGSEVSEFCRSAYEHGYHISIYRYEYMNKEGNWDEYKNVDPDPKGKALQWLRTRQSPDNGSWLDSVGITAMAALTFLNAGCDDGDPSVIRAIQYSRNNVQGDGSISNSDAVTYETSTAIWALVAADLTNKLNEKEYTDQISNAKNWLIKSQWDEDCLWENVNKADWRYGGFGYGENPRPDLSNTQFALMALSAAGLSRDNQYDLWDKAQIFLARCQNRQEDISIPVLNYIVKWDLNYNKHNDGGFVYLPGSSLAGDVNSYGSTTAAGVWSLRLCGALEGDARVQAGLEWLELNEDSSFDDNPNMTEPDGRRFQYYYYMTVAKALTMCSEKLPNGLVDWEDSLSNKLATLQDKDAGNWENSYTGHGSENIPEIASSYSLLALQQTTKELPEGELWMSIILASHADLHIYDPQGRHLGMNYDTGQIENEIPGATFTTDAQARQIVELSQLEAGHYRIELVGTSDGDYTLTVTGYREQDVISSETVAGNIGDGDTHVVDVLVSSLFGALTIFVEEPKVVPSGLVAVPRNQSVALSWTPYQVSGFDLAGYNVYQSTTSGISYEKINPSLVTTVNYLDTSVTNGVTYYYVVTAVSSGGDETSYSSEVTATPSLEASGQNARIICGPNPVGAAGVTFFYALPEGTSTAELIIFNVTGRLLFETSLDVDSTRFLSAGIWDPVDDDGVPLANGPYVYVLIADGKVIGQGKMVIQR